MFAKKTSSLVGSVLGFIAVLHKHLKMIFAVIKSSKVHVKYNLNVKI